MWDDIQIAKSLALLTNHSNPVIKRLIKLQKHAMNNGLSRTVEAGLIALTEQLYQNPKLKKEIKEKSSLFYEYSTQIIKGIDISQEH